MKTVKSIGIFLLVAVLLLIVISFFLPSKVHVERATLIMTEPAVVFNQINDLHNWNNWMPWNKIDPHMKIEYFGAEKGTGAGYKWVSTDKHVGKGSISITESNPGKIITAMNFMENGIATGSFKFEKADGGTKVTWGMDSDMGMNPVKKYFGLFMDQMVGGDFEKGLGDLKKVSESAAIPVAPDMNAMPADSSGMMPDSSIKKS